MKRFRVINQLSVFLKKKHAANWIALVTAISAFLATCIYSTLQYSQNSEHNRQTVKPLINLYLFNGEVDGYKIQNVGVGPAVMHGLRVKNTKSGLTYKKWNVLTQELGYTDIPVCSDVMPNSALGTPVERNLITVKLNKSDNYINQNTTIDLEACYCSVYDDCWISSLKSGIKKTDSCDSFGDIIQC